MRSILALVPPALALLVVGGVAPAGPAPGWRRVEHFRLELAGGAGEGSGPASAEVVGAASLRCRSRAGELQLEWQIDLFGAGTRVLHVERHGPDGSTLVWREMRPGSGRTLTAAREGGESSWRIAEWSGGEAARAEVSAAGVAALPLELLEMARGGPDGLGRGGLSSGDSLSLFDPLSRSFETVTIRTRPAPDELRIDIARADGSLAGLYRIREGRLVGFRWQNGRLSGASVSKEEYERLRERPGKWAEPLGEEGDPPDAGGAPGTRMGERQGVRGPGSPSPNEFLTPGSRLAAGLAWSGSPRGTMVRCHR